METTIKETDIFNILQVKAYSIKLEALKSHILSEEFSAIDLLEMDEEFGKFIDRGNGWFNSNKRDSLGIKRNANGKWQVNWVSQSLQGDIVDLLMYFYNLSFIDALYLCARHDEFETISLPAKREDKKETNYVYKRKFKNLYEELDTVIFKEPRKQHIEYLEKRNVKTDLINKLIRENKMAFDYNNIYFNWQDDNYFIVGSQVEGIYEEKRFKKIIPGSLTNYSFNYKLKGKGNKNVVILTEGVWDLLSFNILYEKFLLNNYDNIIMVSMNGLKRTIIESYKEKYDNYEFVLAIDADDAADKFFNKIKEIYKDIKRSEVKGFKDFNELLQSKEKNNTFIKERNTNMQDFIDKSYKEFKRNQKDLLNGLVAYYNNLINQHNLKLREDQKLLLKTEIRAIEEALKNNSLETISLLLENLEHINDTIKNN